MLNGTSSNPAEEQGDSAYDKGKQAAAEADDKKGGDDGDKDGITRRRGRHEPFLSVFRAYLQLLTVSSILAVDFEIFPRRFAKCETWGTSLGIVAGPKLKSGREGGAQHPNNTDSTLSSMSKRDRLKKLMQSLKVSAPLLLLGYARTVSTKSVNYQEHHSEYGIHWNFFYTLGFIPILVTILQTIAPGLNFAVCGCLVGIVYQILLHLGVEEYILNAPRTDLVSMNKEGIFSAFGYLSIFFIAADLGVQIMRHEDELIDEGKHGLESRNIPDSVESSALPQTEGSVDTRSPLKLKSRKKTVLESRSAAEGKANAAGSVKSSKRITRWQRERYKRIARVLLVEMGLFCVGYVGSVDGLGLRVSRRM
ncbi:Glucosaminyl phosphatidylinositol (GlcN-PI) nositol acylation protein, partial [Quaeritorhiza haematococci]